MDNRFSNLGFTINCSLNAFKNLSTSGQFGGNGGDNCMDTTLRLDFPSYPMSDLYASKGIKRKWSLIDESMNSQVDSSLCLGLGHPSSSSDSKVSFGTAGTTTSSAKETDEESTLDLDLDFTLHLGNDKILSPEGSVRSTMKAPAVQSKVDLELSLSTGTTESDLTTVFSNSTPVPNGIEIPAGSGGAFFIDEGSPSSHWKTGMSLHPLHASPSTESFLSAQVPSIYDPVSDIPYVSPNSMTALKSSLTGSPEMDEAHRICSSKTCQFNGCGKGARGASGFCIAHGGGRRCKKYGCHKGAEGRTVYCKAHGGGRRCEFLGCTKSAEGRTDYCIAHGGGRRCSHEGCTRAARGKSGLCIRHGGGKRCLHEKCTKSAEGLSGLCISHGGGRRCKFPACTKGAQGSTMFCKAHGGGKRCTFEGCTKGAEGSTPFCKGHGGGKRCSFQGDGGVCSKSVHGGTQFCVAHGGGKRCAMPECTKSARGRTDYCVRHGGGKRCKVEGCSKSAQGSTDFCKAHGGGKRCFWGHPGSEFGSQNDSPCNSFARGKTGLCASHNALVQDKRVHGAATIGPVAHFPNPSRTGKMKDLDTSEDMDVDILKVGNRGKVTTNWTAVGLKQHNVPHAHFPVGEGSPLSVPVPEGRVHGGSLMSMLSGSNGD